MKVHELKKALKCFPEDSRVFTDYVPATFPLSSAPCNPSSTYICIEIDDKLEERNEKMLMELGWCREDEYQFWTYYF